MSKKLQRHTLNAHVRRRLRGLVSDERLIHPMLTFDTLAWRSTTRVHIEDGRVGFMSPRSHAIVDIPHCAVLAPPLGNMISTLRKQLRNVALKGTAKLTADRQGVSGTVALDLKACSKKESGDLMDALLKEKSIHGVTLRSPGVNAAAGDPFNPLGPSAVPHPAEAFAQGHQLGNVSLHEDVLEALADSRRVFELYAGSGNFTFGLLHSGKEVHTVEIDRGAVERLREEALSRGLKDKLFDVCGSGQGQALAV